MSPDRGTDVLAAVRDGGFNLTAGKRLAAEAFRHTAFTTSPAPRA